MKKTEIILTKNKDITKDHLIENNLKKLRIKSVWNIYSEVLKKFFCMYIKCWNKTCMKDTYFIKESGHTNKISTNLTKRVASLNGMK